MEQYGEKAVDAESLNAKIHQIENKIHPKEEHKEEIQLDLTATDAVKNLLNMDGVVEKSENDFKNFLDEKAENQKVTTSEEKKS